MFSQGSDGDLPVTARRAKRENGGLGEDSPGSTMTYLQVRPSDLDVWTLGDLPPAPPDSPGSLRSGVRMDIYFNGKYRCRHKLVL
jgi:hypothetical protein